MSAVQQIPWVDGQLVEDDGRAVWRYHGRPVAGWGLGALVVDGHAVPARPSAPRWEVDELDHEVTAGPLQISLRHSLDRTWTVRLSIVNTGAEPVHVDRVGLRFTTGADWVGWALRAGAEASVAALPCRSGDPLVGFSLLQGELRGDGDALEVRSVTLPPSGQHVVRLRGEPYGSAREFGRGRHELLPAWGWVEATEEVEVHHSDLAVVELGSRADVAEDPDASVLAGRPGDTGRLVLAGPRGLVDVTVGFAPGLDQVIDRFVSAGERQWPTGRQGTRIPSAAAGLVVQRHLASQSRGGRPLVEWDEAVDGLCVRCGEPTSAFAVAVLARQAMLTGNAELAERATRGCAELIGADAGLVLVAPEVLAARQLTGLDPTLPRATHQWLADSGGWTPLAASGARLGLGLPGGRVGSDDPVADARLLAHTRMRALVDTTRPRGWACGHDELLARHERRLRHRLHGLATADDPADHRTAGEALAWLVLAPSS